MMYINGQAVAPTYLKGILDKFWFNSTDAPSDTSLYWIKCEKPSTFSMASDLPLTLLSGEGRFRAGYGVTVTAEMPINIAAFYYGTTPVYYPIFAYNNGSWVQANLDSSLVCTTANVLLVKFNNYNREFYKSYSDWAICGWGALSSARPLLVGLTEDSVTFGTNVDSKKYGADGTIEVDGVTYYYNKGSNSVASTSIAVAGNYLTKLNDYFTFAPTVVQAAEKLVALYHNDISKVTS